MEKKIKYANVEQVRQYTKKNGSIAFKYMCHQEKWNKEKKIYDGWEHITVYSDVLHKCGDEIAYGWEQYSSGFGGKYVEVIESDVTEVTEEDNLPF